jgi:hypothetical protein
MVDARCDALRMIFVAAMIVASHFRETRDHP